MSKQDSKKSTVDKSFKFRADATLLSSRSIARGTTFGSEEVEKLSKAKSTKVKKPTAAKVYGNKITFKSKLSAKEDKAKAKMLSYDSIKLLQQSSDDGRILFVHYEKPKKLFYFVIGFGDAAHVRELIDLVEKANSTVKVRRSNDAEIAVFSRDDRSTTDRMLDIVNEPSTETDFDFRRESPFMSRQTLNANMNSGIDLAPQPSPPRFERYSSLGSAAPFFLINGAPAKETYVSTWDQESEFSHRPTNDTRQSESNIIKTPGWQTSSVPPTGHPNVPLRNQFHPSGKLNENHSKSNGLVTKYVYIGPKDEEESVNGNPHHATRRQREYQRSLGRANNYIDMEAGQFEVNSVDRRHSRRHSHGYLAPERSQTRSKSRQSTHSIGRPKSRQLPLSADERKSGWHTEVMFVSPRGNGYNKVTSDGPVMLFSACKKNVADSSSEESDFTDDDDDFGDNLENYPSSSSTLTIDEVDDYRTVAGSLVNTRHH